jgi:type VI secretion system ImpB/VipA family protein
MADLEDAKKGVVNMALPGDPDRGEEPVDIPFILHVLSDLAGDKELADLKDRRFHHLYTREDVDRLIAAIQPELEITVQGPNGPRTIRLKFRSLADFEPYALAMADEQTRFLLEARRRLNRELDDMPGNKSLQKKWLEAMHSRQAMRSLLLEMMGGVQ